MKMLISFQDVQNGNSIWSNPKHDMRAALSKSLFIKINYLFILYIFLTFYFRFAQYYHS